MHKTTLTILIRSKSGVIIVKIKFPGEQPRATFRLASTIALRAGMTKKKPDIQITPNGAAKFMALKRASVVEVAAAHRGTARNRPWV